MDLHSTTGGLWGEELDRESVVGLRWLRELSRSLLLLRRTAELCSLWSLCHPGVPALLSHVGDVCLGRH